MVRMRRLALVTALLVGGGLGPSACERGIGGRDRSKVTAAPVDGRYTLFLRGQSLPQMSADLKRGEPVGFEWDGADVYVVLGQARQKSHPNRVGELVIQGGDNVTRVELRP